MIFGKVERRRTICTSSENLTKSTEIAAFLQGSFYFWPAWVAKCDRICYNITIKIKKAVEKPNGKEAEAHTIHLLARKKEA